jgi:AcrR family transcriptional regulator
MSTARSGAADDAHAGALGLRSRMKQETRATISAAALRLALERGPENVRVDDIADEAGVSPRTYNNYFASREQAICAALVAGQALRVSAALRARPEAEPLGQAIAHAMAEQYDGEPDRRAMAMITASPTLRGEYLRTCEATERLLAQSIAARTGTDPGSDLRPTVLAAAAMAAARVAAERWQESDGHVPFSQLLAEALTHLVPALTDEP